MLTIATTCPTSAAPAGAPQRSRVRAGEPGEGPLDRRSEPTGQDRDALELQLRRIRQVIADFDRAATELDLRARAYELHERYTEALLERAHAKQMRLCNARLTSALAAPGRGGS